MILRWFSSKTVREACTLRKHVLHLLSAQRDILAPAAVSTVNAAANQLRDAMAAGEKTDKIRARMEELDQAANKWLKPYPHAQLRENVEVLLVAIAVAMAIRTFFLQPFKIPTGSMQPTLYGVTSKNYLARDHQPGDAKFVIPTGWQRVKEWFAGISYVHVVAQADGVIESINPMTRFLIFNIRQSFVLGGVEHVMWFPPDYGEAPPGMDPLAFRAGLEPGRVYHRGEDVVKLSITAGDHLFVDRFTYNFRKPQRGEIIVFATAGISEERRIACRIPGDQFYIKRLVGLGGETLSLSPDHEVTGAPAYGGEAVPVGHLVINGQPLSASVHHFENVYSYSGASPSAKTLVYRDNQYYGHALIQELEPGREFHVATNHLFVMGDNTLNSLDSRFWGDFPGDSVIGKSFFVYWPINGRFGWGNQ